VKTLWNLRFVAIEVLCFLAACAPPQRRSQVDITIENPGNEPIELVATAGFVSKTIVLLPKQTWSGYLPFIFVNGGIKIVVQAKK